VPLALRETGDVVGPENALVISVSSTEALTADVRAEVIELCIAAHENEAFRDLFTHFSSGGRHFLAHSGPELVGHAVVSTRWVQPEDRDVMKTAYVDAVSTLPKHQGKGYGSAVMGRLAAEIPDYEIACLQTDEPAFYERLGWEVWRGPLAGRSEAGFVATPDQGGVMVLRLPQTPPVDLDTELSIECQEYRIWE
jgi:aminoglycoside 2'-N-acetyltransferase I